MLGVCRVLVIEDNPGDTFLVEKALSEQGLNCQVESLVDGEQALDYIAALPASLDLILLDLNLPKVDGYAILAAIREQPRLDNVPVIVWSTSRSPESEARLESFKVARYINKPADLDDFLKIGAILGEVLSARPGPLTDRSS